MDELKADKQNSSAKQLTNSALSLYMIVVLDLEISSSPEMKKEWHDNHLVQFAIMSLIDIA